MPIRLVLADDHPLILEALEQLFEPHADFQVLAHCASVAETLQAVRQHRPDGLLLDLYMPEAGGLSVLRQLKQEALSTRIVLLTGVTDEDAMLEAIHPGVCGVALKDMPVELVLQCVRAVHAGTQWLERCSISQALERLLRLEARHQMEEPRPPWGALSPEAPISAAAWAAAAGDNGDTSGLR
jgi:two-component system, NarL family, nitrate/nitrite response regulator NarL